MNRNSLFGNLFSMGARGRGYRGYGGYNRSRGFGGRRRNRGLMMGLIGSGLYYYARKRGGFSGLMNRYRGGGELSTGAGGTSDIGVGGTSGVSGVGSSSDLGGVSGSSGISGSDIGSSEESRRGAA